MRDIETPAEPNDYKGMTWWNAMPEITRAYWCKVADSPRPVDAWRAFCRYGAIEDRKRWM